MFTTTGCFRFAVVISGIFGLAGSGFWPAATAAKNRCKITPFAAAPVSVSRMEPDNFGFTRFTAPPEYVRFTLSKIQSVQSMPSKRCSPRSSKVIWSILAKASSTTKRGSDPFICKPVVECENCAPEIVERCISGVAVGGCDGVWGDWVWAAATDSKCGRVDVYLPNKNARQTLTTNQNDTVTLDITPPSSGKNENCTIWVYHYGEPPPVKKPARRKTLRPKTKPATYGFSTST